MPMPVCTVGHRFEGWCHSCGDGGSWVQGTMVQGVDFVTIEGMPVCVTGSIGQGD